MNDQSDRNIIITIKNKVYLSKKCERSSGKKVQEGASKKRRFRSTNRRGMVKNLLTSRPALGEKSAVGAVLR